MLVDIIECEIEYDFLKGYVMGKKAIKIGKGKLHINHASFIAALLFIFDMIMVNISYFLALWFRFDCNISRLQMETTFLSSYMRFIPIYTIFCAFIFIVCKLYRSIWRFVSYSELFRCIVATAITTIFYIVGIAVICPALYVIGWTFLPSSGLPVSVYLLGAVLQFIFILGVRFSYRFISLLKSKSRTSNEYVPRVMLIGAGEAGQMILRDIEREGKDKVCCIIDDNSNKWGRNIDGVTVVGGRDDILANVEKYHINKIFLAIPSASEIDKRDILNICSESGCELKALPGIYQIVSGEVDVTNMKDVSVEDLLGRDPITINDKEVSDYLNEKVVLVTGGGGSIGSELCRQIAKRSPKQLIIFDIYENNAYEIENELRKDYPDLDLVVLIGSVRDSRRICQIFHDYRPHIVYHAAAHKHVPLMETSPCEAIKNNAIGTYKTAYAALMYNAEKFVLISTDKAVNPTNIMGASKRLCEMIVQAFDAKTQKKEFGDIPMIFTHLVQKNEDVKHDYWIPDEAKTSFVAVRFGNVLGSNGSVIPLFKKQIKEGGPVTVTHPDIIRYFMTIPEAVSLVLQAGTYAKGGEIFVLDMGDPVKIDSLARNLIKLSGFKPDVDIKIEYTGLRPGEKLYEEKLMAEEGLKVTPNKLIHIGLPLAFDHDEFLKRLPIVMNNAYMNVNEDIIKDVKSLVTTYTPSE